MVQTSNQIKSVDSVVKDLDKWRILKLILVIILVKILVKIQVKIQVKILVDEHFLFTRCFMASQSSSVSVVLPTKNLIANTDDDK